MILSADHSVFSIPFRFLQNSLFLGNEGAVAHRPNGLARFVGDDNNRVLRMFAQPEIAADYLKTQSHVWPLTLFGPAGTGKTSLGLMLLSGLTQCQTVPYPGNQKSASSKKNPAKGMVPKGIVLDVTDFERRFRSALTTDTVDDFRSQFDHAAGMMLDNAHLLADKWATQQELLVILDRMLANRQPIIFTMDREPVLHERLIPKLVSRLSGGLTLPVNEPGQPARTAIIRELTQLNGLNMGDAMVEQLSNRLSVSVPKIVHFIGQLKLACSIQPVSNGTVSNGEQGTIEIDDAIINQLFHRSEESQDRLAKAIVQHVARSFQLKPKDLASDSRKQSIVFVRDVAIYLIRKLLGLSFLKIGGYFGNRDHSTVMHAYRKIEKLLHQNENEKVVSRGSSGSLSEIKLIEQQLANLFASDVAF